MSRHWQLTVFVTLVSIVALFMGKLDGGSFSMVVGTVIGSFRVGDAFDTWVREK